MIVSETDAALLPSYKTYEVGEAFFRPLVDRLGGFTVHNAEALRPLDGQSFILAPNHRSNWDSIVLGLAMVHLPDVTQDAELGPLQPRAIRFMAKASLWRYPIVRQFVEGCGAFPVQRDRGVGLDKNQVDHITDLADHNAALVIYPQGHRERGSEDEESLVREKFRTTIAHLHLQYGIPLVPVGLYGPVGRGLKFPRTLTFGEPIFSDGMNFGDGALKPAKRAVMDELHERTNEVYQQARGLHLRNHAPTGWLRNVVRFGRSG